MTREEALEILTNHTQYKCSGDDLIALDKAIETLEQEPKIEVLDKIISEIKGKYRVILKGTPKDDWAVRWNDCIDEVLHIIDKYKEESEVRCR